MPVCSTNKVPHRACRSGTRGLPCTTLLEGLLLAADHTYRPALEEPPPGMRPAVVKRVMDVVRGLPADPTMPPGLPLSPKSARAPCKRRPQKPRYVTHGLDPGSPPAAGTAATARCGPRNGHRHGDSPPMGIRPPGPVRATLPGTGRGNTLPDTAGRPAPAPCPRKHGRFLRLADNAAL